MNLKADHVFYRGNWYDYNIDKDFNDVFLKLKLEEQEKINLDFDVGEILLGFAYEEVYENIKYKGVGAKFQMKLAQGDSFEDILTNTWDAIDDTQLSFTASNIVRFYPTHKSGGDDIITEYEDYKLTSRVENMKSQEGIDVLISGEVGSMQEYLDKPLPIWFLPDPEEKLEGFEFWKALGKQKTKGSLKVTLYSNCFYGSKPCDQLRGEITFQSSILAKDGGVSLVFDTDVDFDIKKIHEIGLHGNVEEWLKNDNLNIKIIMKGKNFIDDQYHKELENGYKAGVDDFNNIIDLDIFDNELYRNQAFNVRLIANEATLLGKRDWLLIDSTFKKNINDNVKGYTLSARSDPLEMGVIPDQYLHVDLCGDYGIEKFLPIKLFSEDERESALSLIKSKDKDQLKVIIEGESAHRIINGVKFNCGGLFTFSECKLVKSN